MNPNSGGEAQPNFNAPVPEAGGEAQQDKALEQATPDENRVGKAQPQLTPAPVVPVAPVFVASDQGVSADDAATAATTPSDTPAAGDHHVIERQWVDKAKAIIAQTKDDPFAQKKEMSKAKAEYIQKRFSKTIPTDDTVRA